MRALLFSDESEMQIIINVKFFGFKTEKNHWNKNFKLNCFFKISGCERLILDYK